MGSPSARLPITRDLTLAYVSSLVVVALGVTPSTAGILMPGFLAQDAFTRAAIVAVLALAAVKFVIAVVFPGTV